MDGRDRVLGSDPHRTDWRSHSSTARLIGERNNVMGKLIRMRGTTGCRRPGHRYRYAALAVLGAAVFDKDGNVVSR